MNGEETAKRAEMARIMALAVSLRIARYQVQGGPTRADVQRAHTLNEELEGEFELLLFGGGKPGETAELFNRVADAVAILAFQPNGIEYWGTHHQGYALSAPEMLGCSEEAPGGTP